MTEKEKYLERMSKRPEPTQVSITINPLAKGKYTEEDLYRFLNEVEDAFDNGLTQEVDHWDGNTPVYKI